MAQDANTVVDATDKMGPLTTPAEKAVGVSNTWYRTIVFADGHTQIFAYDHRTPPPIPTIGQPLASPESQGTMIGEGTDRARQSEWDKGQKPSAVTGTGEVRNVPHVGPVQMVRNPDGTLSEQPVTGANGQAIAPAPQVHTWAVVHDPSTGGWIRYDTMTGQVDTVLDAQGNPSSNPTTLAQAQATLNQTQATTANTYQQIQNAGVTNAINVNTDARATQKQQYDQHMDDIANRLKLGSIDEAQAYKEAEAYHQYFVDLPRQAASDANSARTSTLNAAQLQQQSNLARENYAQQAGSSAVSDAQWQTQHGVSGGALANLAAMQQHPGQVGIDYSTPLPMPNFGQIRAQGEQGLRDRVAPFEQTYAQTAPYQSFQPDLGAAVQYWNHRVAPSMMFGQGLPPYPMPQYGQRFQPPTPQPVPADSMLNVVPWYGNAPPPPDWGMEPWRQQRQTSPAPDWAAAGY